MPTNNFKLFDQNKANMLTDTEYANSAQRLNGVQTGVASSQLNNKFAYQASLVAYAIAQIMNQNNLDASDTLAVSAFVGNLGAALLQKVADKASSTEAAAGVLNNKYITPATMKAAALLLSGGTMSGDIDMNFSMIKNLDDPTNTHDAANKWYVDNTKTNLEREIGNVSNKIILTRKTIYSATNLSVTEDGITLTTAATSDDIKNTFAIRMKGSVNFSNSFSNGLRVGIEDNGYNFLYSSSESGEENTEFDSIGIINYSNSTYRYTTSAPLLDFSNPTKLFLNGGSKRSPYSGIIIFNNIEIQLLINT